MSSKHLCIAPCPAWNVLHNTLTFLGMRACKKLVAKLSAPHAINYASCRYSVRTADGVAGVRRARRWSSSLGRRRCASARWTCTRARCWSRRSTPRARPSPSSALPWTPCPRRAHIHCVRDQWICTCDAEMTLDSSMTALFLGGFSCRAFQMLLAAKRRGTSMPSCTAALSMGGQFRQCPMWQGDECNNCMMPRRCPATRTGRWCAGTRASSTTSRPPRR